MVCISFKGPPNFEVWGVRGSLSLGLIPTVLSLSESVDNDEIITKKLHDVVKNILNENC